MTTTILNCSRCQQPMPALPDDLASLLRKGVAVTLTHDVCPGEAAPPAPKGRYFEVRCRIVEVTEPEVMSESVLPPKVEELASFVAGVRAVDLEAAMRPLADELAGKWLEVEKHAQVADPRSAVNTLN